MENMEYNLIVKVNNGKTFHMGRKLIGGFGQEFVSTGCGSGFTPMSAPREYITNREFVESNITCKKCLKKFQKLNGGN